LLQLQPSTAYQVTVSGEAYLSDQTGAQADPFPGVVLAYATNEDDGWAMLYRVARPGDTFEFRTSVSTGSQYDFHLLAFFLDPYSNSPNRGSYTVHVTRK